MIKPAVFADLAIVCLVAMLAGAVPAVAGSDTPKPPADLVNLEREVSLKIAHVRGEGPTDPASARNCTTQSVWTPRPSRKSARAIFAPPKMIW